MQLQQSQRALDVMRCARPEQRRCSRVQLNTQAVATFSRNGTEAQPAFLRDISVLGAFFFCKTRPEICQVASLRLVLGDTEPLHVICEGVVVRVEDHPTQEAAIGVAVQFTKYEVVKTAGLTEKSHPNSFVGWSLEMVEKLFLRRAEMEKYAWRIQGAA